MDREPLGERTLKVRVFREWMQNLRDRVTSNQLMIKAMRFHDNNQQVHLKLVFFYMRKITKKQR